MKLFRTANSFSESSMKHFLKAYILASKGSVSDEAVDELYAESRFFEPLTWLEAAVFFLALPIFKAEDTSRWNSLAVDRWQKFMATKHKLTPTVSNGESSMCSCPEA